MIIIVILAMLLITLNYLKDKKINNLKNELDIKVTENKNLKRVLYENDLIPKKFVDKEDF